MDSSFIENLWLQLEKYYVDLAAILPKLIFAIIIFLIFYFVAIRSHKLVRKRLLTRMDDPLLAGFIARLVRIVFIIVAVMIFLKVVGLTDIAAGLVTGASVSAIVVGFAFKDIGENFLAGIMLAFNRPFRVGDFVELNGHEGKVVSLNFKNTQIKTFDGKYIYIPNANIIKNPVINYTIDGFLRYDFVVGVDYGSDVGKAIQIILDELNDIPGILDGDKAPSVSILSLSASTLNLTIYYWLDTFDKSFEPLQVKTEATDRVLSALVKQGYYLPGDILELKNYNQSTILMGQSDIQTN